MLYIYNNQADYVLKHVLVDASSCISPVLVLVVYSNTIFIASTFSVFTPIYTVVGQMLA